MRYLILSDIHSNDEALAAVLARVRRKRFDRVVVLGDFVGYGANPNQVIDRIRNIRKPKSMIRGNHDKVVCGARVGRPLQPGRARGGALDDREAHARATASSCEALPLGPIVGRRRLRHLPRLAARRGRLHLLGLRRLPELPRDRRGGAASSATATSPRSSRSSRTASSSSSSKASASATRSRRGCATSSTRARSASRATATPPPPTRSTTRTSGSCTSTACRTPVEKTREKIYKAGLPAHPRRPAARGRLRNRRVNSRALRFGARPELIIQPIQWREIGERCGAACARSERRFCSATGCAAHPPADRAPAATPAAPAEPAATSTPTPTPTPPPARAFASLAEAEPALLALEDRRAFEAPTLEAAASASDAAVRARAALSPRPDRRREGVGRRCAACSRIRLRKCARTRRSARPFSATRRWRSALIPLFGDAGRLRGRARGVGGRASSRRRGRRRRSPRRSRGAHRPRCGRRCCARSGALPRPVARRRRDGLRRGRGSRRPDGGDLRAGPPSPGGLAPDADGGPRRSGSPDARRSRRGRSASSERASRSPPLAAAVGRARTPVTISAMLALAAVLEKNPEAALSGRPASPRGRARRATRIPTWRFRPWRCCGGRRRTARPSAGSGPSRPTGRERRQQVALQALMAGLGAKALDLADTAIASPDPYLRGGGGRGVVLPAARRRGAAPREAGGGSRGRRPAEGARRPEDRRRRAVQPRARLPAPRGPERRRAGGGARCARALGGPRRRSRSASTWSRGRTRTGTRTSRSRRSGRPRRRPTTPRRAPSWRPRTAIRRRWSRGWPAARS